jgi:hypothetical protein
MPTTPQRASILRCFTWLTLVIGLAGCASTAPFAPTATPAAQSRIDGKSFSIVLPVGWTAGQSYDIDGPDGSGVPTPVPGTFGFTTVVHQSSVNFVSVDEHKPASVVLATYCSALAAHSAVIAGLPMQHDTNTAPGTDAWHFVNKSNVSYDIVLSHGASSIDQTQRDALLQVLASFTPLDSTSACS